MDETNQPTDTTTYPSVMGIVEKIRVVVRVEWHIGSSTEELRRCQRPANTVKTDKRRTSWDHSRIGIRKRDRYQRYPEERYPESSTG